MPQANDFSRVATDSIARLRDIVERFSTSPLPDEASRRLLAEIRQHEETLQAAFCYRKANGPALGGADSDAYFSEKLGALVDFVRMSVDPTLRGGFTPSEISENVAHYSYLVARLVVADWASRSRRPVSDKTLKESGFEHREALLRLASR